MHQNDSKGFRRLAIGTIIMLGLASCGDPTEIDQEFAESANGLTGGNGLRGEYFDNVDFTSLKVTRVDPTINFNWGTASPDRSIGVDSFSVRWTGRVSPAFSEKYRFYTSSDDGVRLWVDGKLLIDNWTDHAATENSGTIDLKAEAVYDIKMEFYDRGDAATATLSWSSPSVSKQIVPQNRLFQPGTSSPPPSAAAAPAVRDKSMATAHNTATLRINKPTATQPGDLLVAIVGNDAGNTYPIATPQGWTAVPNTNVSASGYDAHGYAFYKVASASEPASYAFVSATGYHWDMTGGIFAVSGADPTNPIHASGAQGHSNGAAPDCPTPSLTTTIANTLLLYGCVATNTLTSYGPPAGTTEAWDAVSGNSSYDYPMTTEAASRVQAAAGPTGSLTATATSGHPVSVGTLIAIAPASSGGSGGTPPPSEPPPSTGGTLNLPLVPWEGGSAYWAKFPAAAAAGWTNPSFFPVGVWLQSIYEASFFKAAGINTIVGVNHDGASLSLAQQAGLFLIVQDEWSRAEIGSHPSVVGWLTRDECDMNCGSPIADMQASVNKFRSYNDGRFTYANFGKGALGNGWNWQSMPTMVQMNDVASDDLYFYNDPFLPDETRNAPAWPAGAVVRNSSSYGWTMGRMRSFLDQAKLHPTWNFVEAGHPFSEPESQSPTITPDQLEGAVWASIIQEARGILYFDHSFGGACTSVNTLRDCNPATKARVTAVNAQIQSLAPVLNTQSYVFNASSSAATMTKTYKGSVYIFAGVAQKQTAGTKTFTLPSGVRGTSVTVVGENRTIPVVNRGFVDTFASEFSHHTYQIAL